VLAWDLANFAWGALFEALLLCCFCPAVLLLSSCCTLAHTAAAHLLLLLLGCCWCCPLSGQTEHVGEIEHSRPRQRCKVSCSVTGRRGLQPLVTRWSVDMADSGSCLEYTQDLGMRVTMEGR
jgi:hypothetical protein